jgi:preprotein translocase subunit SecE
MANPSPALFIRQVRQELSKVTWPSRREVTVSTVMIFIFCIALGLYFLVIDKLLTWGVSLIFG